MPIKHGIKLIKTALMPKCTFSTATRTFYKINFVPNRTLALNLSLCLQHRISSIRTKQILPTSHVLATHYRDYCSKKDEVEETEKKPSLFVRFKQMYKDYWYVLVPVHVVSSGCVFGIIYYSTKSGVDIASAMEYFGEPGQKLAEKLRNGNGTMEYLTVSFAIYKILTPIRYAITLGGTTVSIKYLRDWGYIKPIPPKEKIKTMIIERKEVIKNKGKELYEKEKELMNKDDGFFRVIIPKFVLKKKDKVKKN